MWGGGYGSLGTHAHTWMFLCVYMCEKILLMLSVLFYSTQEESGEEGEECKVRKGRKKHSTLGNFYHPLSSLYLFVPSALNSPVLYTL